MDETLIWYVLFLLLAVLGTVVALALNRKRKSKVLVVVRDLRNPSKRPRRYYALDDKKSSGIKLYTNLFKPAHEKLVPRFDMNAYEFDRRIYAVVGVSGHAEDDTLVPIHVPLVSGASAYEFSEELAGAVQKTHEYYDMVKELNLGSRVKLGAIEGDVASCGYEGVAIDYDTAQADGTLARQRIFISDPEEIRKMQVLGRGNGPKPHLSDMFNAQWVVNNFGIVPIDSVMVPLISNKEAVAQFNSKLNDRARSHESWLYRNREFVVLLMGLFVIMISGSVLWYGTVNAVSQYLAGAGQSVISLPHTSVLPNATG